MQEYLEQLRLMEIEIPKYWYQLSAGKGVLVSITNLTEGDLMIS